jgi:hypothetical protein
MTLDLILFAPEFFFLFSFFVLLWYGTGNRVTPVAEILTVTTVHSPRAAPLGFLRDTKISLGYAQKNKAHTIVNNKGYSRNRTRGPNHAVSALTLWAVVWCFLSF